MHSVADDLTNELIRESAALTVEERIRRALQLGARDLELFASRQGLGQEEARRQLQQQRQQGRRSSGVIKELLK